MPMPLVHCYKYDYYVFPLKAPVFPARMQCEDPVG